MPVIQPITSASSGSAYVPTSRTLTINGVTYDLTADRSWTIEVIDSLVANAPLSYNSGTNTLSISQASASSDGYLSSTDWLTFSSKQPAITLTTTGNSGAASLVGATLNIPEYTLAGLGGFSNPMTSLGDIIYGNAVGIALRRAGNTTTTKMFLSQTGDGTNSAAPTWSVVTAADTGAVPTSRQLTINGTAYDLSSDRSWTIPTHDSVTIGTANGLSLSGQVLSLGLSSSSTNGALSSTDWSTFNSKQPALNGTGFVKISGTTISYDNSTYYLASNPSNYITLTSLSAGTGISYNNTTGVISSTITQYTDALARASISETITGIDYNNTTGVFSTTSGYGIPTTASQTNWDSAYNNMIVSAAVTGTTTKTLTLTQQDSGTITASWTDINTDAVTSVFGRTGAVVATNGDYTTAQVTESGNLYYTDARARASITLTTTGSSGSSTYNSSTGVLNVPTYTAAGLGAVPTTRTLTINDVAYDLSANREWSVGDYGTW